MNSKKKIPLSILEILEPLILKNTGKIKLINPDNFLVKLIDTDSTSNFYLNIEQSKVEGGSVRVLIDRNPRNKDIVGNFQTWVEAKNLEQYFNDWVSFIEGYEKIKSIYDDPIQRKYQEEFYSEFEILDEDAGYVSFNLDQQIWIDEYLDRIILALDKHMAQEDKDVEEIKIVAIQLKSDLTSLTKKVIIQKLSLIWSKARKHGLAILKEVYIEFRKELIKQLIQGQLQQ